MTCEPAAVQRIGTSVCSLRKGARPAFQRAIGRQAARPCNGGGGYFPPRPEAALCIATQNSRRPPSSAVLRPLSLRSTVQARSARRRVIAVKAAMGAAIRQKGDHHGDRS